MGEEDSFARGRQSACAEALGLYRMLGHDGNTIEAIDSDADDKADRSCSG
jgi:hypothetical protein